MQFRNRLQHIRCLREDRVFELRRIAHEGVERANSSRYALGATVFSRARGEELAHRLRAGMVAVNSVHAVGVTYYQWDVNTSVDSEPTVYRIKQASPAVVTATTATSLEAVPATTVLGPFNMLDAPFASGYFTGDYEGLASSGTAFLPFVVATNCTDLSCRALTSVAAPANRAPTNNNSTDVLVGLGL